MWFLPLALFLAIGSCQVNEDNFSSSTRPPWNRYDDPARDQRDPNLSYTYGSGGLNENIIVKEA